MIKSPEINDFDVFFFFLKKKEENIGFYETISNVQKCAKIIK